LARFRHQSHGHDSAIATHGGNAIRRLRNLALFGLGALLVFPVASSVSQEKPAVSQEKKDTDKKPAVAGPVTPVYKPPLRGAPAAVWAAEPAAQRARCSSCRSWRPTTAVSRIRAAVALLYISAATALPVELTVMDPDTTQPLLEIRVATPIEAGIHRLRLSDHGVRLAPGRAYRWYVAVVPDSGRRSRDILAGGAIQR